MTKKTEHCRPRRRAAAAASRRPEIVREDAQFNELKGIGGNNFIEHTIDEGLFQKGVNRNNRNDTAKKSAVFAKPETTTICTSSENDAPPPNLRKDHQLQKRGGGEPKKHTFSYR